MVIALENLRDNILRQLDAECGSREQAVQHMIGWLYPSVIAEEIEKIRNLRKVVESFPKRGFHPEKAREEEKIEARLDELARVLVFFETPIKHYDIVLALKARADGLIRELKELEPR